VFLHTGNAWSHQAYVKASNTDLNDEFGYAVALSSDGESLVVTAGNESSDATGVGGDQTNNNKAGAGAFYLY
jgi:hypothetical protein